ncbi:MAG TPA: flagellar motor switch protein FliN, partial [Clostridia bacterium]|nr:flagellar motor switch protein FliN [Clostridia bacterium]
FIKGLEGKGALIVGENDVVEISSLLAPEQDEDGASGTLNDFSVQLSDAVSQALSSALKRPIGVSAAPFSAMDYEKIHALLKNEDILIITSFGLKVKEGSYRIEILAPLSLGRRILDCMYYLAEKLSSGETGNGLSENNTAKKDSGQEDKIDVSPVKFQEFDIDADSEKVPDNIDIIMDVPMTVTVELGKTYKPIREILKITNGSIIGLDKLVGEPVDILVNGKQIAKGEVVVIDENFGVRINDIISAKSRLQKLC